MTSSWKPKPSCFGSDIHRLLLAAEAGQKADILTYSSGHLGPHSLKQSLSHREEKQPFWKMSQSQEESPNPLTAEQTRTNELTYVKRKEMKDSHSEFSVGKVLAQSEVSRSTQDQGTDLSSQADKRENISLPKIFSCTSTSLSVQPRAFSQKKWKSASNLEGKQQFYSSYSEKAVPNNEGQQKTKEQLGLRVIDKLEHWAGINVAEIHEKKLQKGLKKLSAQCWPSRDRLVVFSDVFDDVCEGSPVFGRILREIKTDYDLYVNHLMASQSSPHNMPPSISLKDFGSGKIREMELEDSEKEVCRLEQEARRALEEKKRVQSELQNVPGIIDPEDIDMKNTSLSGLQDRGTAIGSTESVQSKRLQVLNTWREIQKLEDEIKEKLVSTATTTATERSIKDLKTQIIRLIASNDCLETTTKDLENNINMVLAREKTSKAMRRMLWDEIRCGLQTKSE